MPVCIKLNNIIYLGDAESFLSFCLNIASREDSWMQRRNCESDLRTGHMKKKTKCAKIWAVSCVVLGYGSLPCLGQSYYFWMWQAVFIWVFQVILFRVCQAVFFSVCQVVFFKVCQVFLWPQHFFLQVCFWVMSSCPLTPIWRNFWRSLLCSDCCVNHHHHLVIPRHQDDYRHHDCCQELWRRIYRSIGWVWARAWDIFQKCAPDPGILRIPSKVTKFPLLANLNARLNWKSLKRFKILKHARHISRSVIFEFIQHSLRFNVRSQLRHCCFANNEDSDIQQIALKSLVFFAGGFSSYMCF